MKNYKRFCLAPLLIFLLTGCELPKYPIDDPPVVKIDSRLLGTWAENKKDLSETYTLSKKDAVRYILTLKRKKDKPEKFVAWLSDVEQNLFLNVYCHDTDDAGYIFVRILEYNATDKSLQMACVKDTTMKYLTTSAQIRERITSRINDPAFYGDTGKLYKVK
jgi:hypothetical protein